MEHVLREARQSFECVLIDTPPVLVVSDALAISRAWTACSSFVRLSQDDA